MMITSSDLPPQRSPAELERDSVWLANCVVALEIAAQKGAGTPAIRNGAALHQKRGRMLEQALPNQASRADRLEATRKEWAALLEGKSAEARHEELDFMLGVCGAEY